MAFFNSKDVHVPSWSSSVNNSLLSELLGKTGLYRFLGGSTRHLTKPMNLSFMMSSTVVDTLYFLNPTA